MTIQGLLTAGGVPADQPSVDACGCTLVGYHFLICHFTHSSCNTLGTRYITYHTHSAQSVSSNLCDEVFHSIKPLITGDGASYVIMHARALPAKARSSLLCAGASGCESFFRLFLSHSHIRRTLTLILLLFSIEKASAQTTTEALLSLLGYPHPHTEGLSSLWRFVITPPASSNLRQRESLLDRTINLNNSSKEAAHSGRVSGAKNHS